MFTERTLFLNFLKNSRDLDGSQFVLVWENRERDAVFWLALLLACSACALALDPSLDISQYAHTAWTVRDGFGKGPIHSIAQTHDGYLWLGTEFGLLRFDGVRAVPWQPPGGEHLPGNVVTEAAGITRRNSVDRHWERPRKLEGRQAGPLPGDGGMDSLMRSSRIMKARCGLAGSGFRGMGGSARSRMAGLVFRPRRRSAEHIRGQ